jgi:hypothetical protein
MAGTRKVLASSPHLAVHHLLGEHLIPGSTGRLCIIGVGLRDVEDVLLSPNPLRVQIVTISDGEIIVDVPVPAHAVPGVRQIVLRTSAGVYHPCGSAVTISYSMADACPSSGSTSDENSGFPQTPGFCEGDPSQAVEQYYAGRPTTDGIGANLL